jgi:hypothetical protein
MQPLESGHQAPGPYPQVPKAHLPRLFPQLLRPPALIFNHRLTRCFSMLNFFVHLQNYFFRDFRRGLYLAYLALFGIISKGRVRGGGEVSESRWSDLLIIFTKYRVKPILIRVLSRAY